MYTLFIVIKSILCARLNPLNVNMVIVNCMLFIARHFYLIYKLLLLTLCIFNLQAQARGCFSLDFFINLHSVSLDIYTEDGLFILNMNPGDNPGGSFPGWNPTPGGEPGPGGGPKPGGPGESGGPYPGGSNTSGDQNISSHPYDPSGSIPPANNQDLYRLIVYKLTRHWGFTGASTTVSVSQLFGKDTMVNNIAKQMLYAHILDHKAELPIAFTQLDPLNHPGRWASVSISLTSPIVISLKNSL